MALHGHWRNWVVGAALAAMTAGCSKDQPTHADLKPSDASPPAASINGPVAGQQGAGDAKPDRLHLPFGEACTVEINADAGAALPPTFTINGKNSGQLNEDVQKLWDTIKFAAADGKRQTYVLQFEVVQGESELGTIEILMQPELAPNHVRNFVALTMLGFYDGLHVDRIVRQQGEGDAAASKLVLLEAGSPTENADPASSHLGYWLKPEFNKDIKHEEGTVGACLMATDDNAETAACRFYINLTQAPAMDGNFTVFGKVIKGIEVARKLAEQPVRDRDAGPDQGRPITPITIRKATAKPVPVVE